MNLYERQSTFNPNMPVRGLGRYIRVRQIIQHLTRTCVRGLSYFARLYEAYMGRYGLDVYGKKLIRLPLPQYIVFYNGRKDQPDEMELRLSDAFVPPVSQGQEPVLECRVRMLNINMGHNKELMRNCRRL